VCRESTSWRRASTARPRPSLRPPDLQNLEDGQLLLELVDEFGIEGIGPGQTSEAPSVLLALADEPAVRVFDLVTLEAVPDRCLARRTAAG
jgi:hypothetical protein